MGVEVRNVDNPGDMTLSGKVLGPDDKPVPLAVVLVDTVPTRRVSTDSKGEFRIEGLLGRSYIIRVRTPTLVGEVPVFLASDLGAIVVRLSPGARLHTRILGPNGEPVPNAEVRVRSEEILGTTDLDGQVWLAPISIGWNDIEVSHSDYADAIIELYIESSAIDERITVQLRRGFSVSGRVVDESGKGIPGARIFDVTEEPSHRVREIASTDRSGAFESTLQHGLHTLVASDGNHIPGVVSKVWIDDNTANLTIAMSRGGMLQGRVTSDNGASVSQATVRAELVSDGGRLPALWRALTTEEGEFELGGLPPGSYIVRAESQRGASLLTDVEVLAEGEVTRVELTLPPSAPVVGIVVDDRGAPVGGVLVTATSASRLPISASTLTGDDGRFSIVGIPSDEYAFHVCSRSSERRRHTETLQGSSGDVVLILPRTGALVGRIKLTNGLLSSGFYLELDGEAGNEEWVSKMHFEGERFELNDIYPGMYKIHVLGDEFSRSAVENVLVRPAMVTDVGAIPVEIGSKISGTVADLQGSPVAGAIVTLGDRAHTGGRFDRTTRADALGKFLFQGVPRDRSVYVVAAHDTLGRSDPTVVGRPGLESPTRLVLRPTALVSGVVNDSNGVPIAEAFVALGIPELRVTTTDTNGRFVFGDVPVGRHALRASLGGDDSMISFGIVDSSRESPGSTLITIADGDASVIVDIADDGSSGHDGCEFFLVSGSIEVFSRYQMFREIRTGTLRYRQWQRGGGRIVEFSHLAPGVFTLCVSRSSGSGGYLSVDVEIEHESLFVCYPVDASSGSARIQVSLHDTSSQ